MPLKPDDIWPRMLEILEGEKERAAGRLEALLAEVLELVATQLPQIDLERLRRGFQTRVEACREKPRIFAPTGGIVEAADAAEPLLNQE